MLRGLVIKQIFFVVDLLLMAAIGIALVLAVLRIMDSGTEGLGTQATVAEGDSGIQYAGLLGQEAYAAINANKLFGKAGQQSIATFEDAPAVASTQEIQETTLQLNLLGCTSVGPTDPYSCATIVNLRESDSKKKERVYFVGQTIMAGVTLAEVHKRYVVLHAGPNPQYLLMDKGDTAAVAPTPREAVPTAAVEPQTAPGVVTLNRQELLQEMMQAENLETIAASARDVTDEAGNVIGVTADGIGDVELAAKMGFAEGDVVQQINGQPVKGVDNLGELVQQFSDMSAFRISVMRNGQPKMITIRLQ